MNQKCHQCQREIESKNIIVISDELDLVFCSEECLYKHFSPQIVTLEKEFESTRKGDDIARSEFEKYEECLGELLADPDEVWEDTESIAEYSIQNFIGEFEVDGESVYYVAVTYVSGEDPTFVFLHFPTQDLKLVEHYRRGHLDYSRQETEIDVEGVEGDALSQGDPLAGNLFKAMLTLRGKGDISEEDFPSYVQYRQESVEDADEIWRSNDLQGNILVTFIKEFEEGDDRIFYLVVTLEDTVANSHFILFSFPTSDSNMVERYRNGERLDHEEPNPQESH